MRQVRYVIIGCGMIAKYHVAAIENCAEAQAVGVYGTDPTRTGEFAKQHGLAVYPETADIWADGDVDAVCVCTPSGFHAAYALEAIEHGKHVLIEKPMALTVSDCDRILREAKKKHVLVGVVSQLRFSPAVVQVKRAMERGVLGKMACADLYMKYHRSQAYYDSAAWRGTWKMDGGGALMNQGIHGVDLLQYLAGPVDSIYAKAKTQVRKIEVEDTLSAVAEFHSGAIGVIQAATSLYSGFSRRLELCGEKGTIILEEDKILLWDVADEPIPPQEQCRGQEIRGFSDPSRISCLGHTRQIANFTAAVQGREALLVDGQEGRKVLRIILGAYRSSAENRPIRLTEVD